MQNKISTKIKLSSRKKYQEAEKSLYLLLFSKELKIETIIFKINLFVTVKNSYNSNR